jgi:predicted DNA-binding protein (UPF0251 family)
MPRPKCCRTVGGLPAAKYFKPQGIPLTELEDVVLSIDEYESVRLADYERLYQERAAERMNVSRQTFGRIVESAHRKIAEALINGKALKIEGGDVRIRTCRKNRVCAHTGKPPEKCPLCKKNSHAKA